MHAAGRIKFALVLVRVRLVQLAERLEARRLVARPRARCARRCLLLLLLLLLFRTPCLLSLVLESKGQCQQWV